MKTFKQFLAEDRWYDEPEYVNFGNAQLRQLYGAIQSAEHRGTKIQSPYGYNPEVFIRTRSPVTIDPETGKKSVSTAYGPTQITRSTVSGFMKKQPQLFKGLEDYTSKYLAQGTQMLAKGGYGSNKKYGGGGEGDLAGEQYLSPYQQMTGAVMRGKMNELGIDITKDISPKDRERFVRSWRGVSRSADPKYYQTIDRFLSGQ